MFTGIVEGVGEVASIQTRGEDLVLELRFPRELGWADDVQVGDSIAVDGACLTVEQLGGEALSVCVVPATLSRTLTEHYDVGTRINLERAARLDRRLDGHLVQGHVDGLGEVVAVRSEPGDLRLRIRVPGAVAAQTVPQGSITINGVSLTVQSLSPEDVVEVAIIPFTAGHTNLGAVEVGAWVNVEGDLIAKYVGKMLAPYMTPLDSRGDGGASSREGALPRDPR